MTKIPNISMDMSRLPLPDIRDDIIKYSHKQSSRREDANRFRPPKYKPRYDSNFNRSHSHYASIVNASHTAQAISFRSEYNELSQAYNSLTNESYFEQVFTSLCKIGEGSFGEVFKVRSKEDGHLYAVKMSKQLFRGEQYRAERLEEVRRYEQFSGHENCIRFYRAWEQNDRLYMQMELCRESLETYLFRRKQIPESRIWSILLDLLLALKSLHDRNLLHLDIKLDNVLIDDDDTCKLADFGLVIDVDKANRHQATEGDSRYIAPEIMQGNFSKAADIFSLGIAMLELSCYLELPANGLLWQQLRHGVLPEEFLRNISVELQNIIKGMMAPNPKNRPTVDHLLAHKHFTTLLHRRHQWQPIRRLHCTIRRSHRFVWSKLGNIKSAAFRFVTFMMEALHLRNAITNNPSMKVPRAEVKANASNVPNVSKIRFQIVGSTPIANKANNCHVSEFLSDDTGFEISQQGTPSNFSSEAMFNSTPINRSVNTLFSLPQKSNSASPALDTSNSKYLSFKELEASKSNSFIRRPQDCSSLRRKLFSQSNE